MLTALDHLIVGVRDLGAAEKQTSALLGREPSWRGAHPGAGTENVLYRLENTYLELLAPAGEGGVAAQLREHLEVRGEGLLGLAFATGDAEALREALAARGLDPSPVVEGEGRERDSGARRAWRQVVLPAKGTRGLLLFGIEHRTAPEALPPAPAAAPEPGTVHALDHVVVRTAAPEAAIALYGEALGLRLALDRSFEDRGLRLLFFRVGGATVEVSGRLGAEPAPDAPDKLWGLAWQVPDADAAHARLAAAGFDVNGVRDGFKPGTRVFTVRGEPCGVATLVIRSPGGQYWCSSPEELNAFIDHDTWTEGLYHIWVGAREPEVHILVNNAGANWGAPLEEYPDAGWDKVFNLNLKGPFHATVKMLPMLRKAANPADPARDPEPNTG